MSSPQQYADQIYEAFVTQLPGMRVNRGWTTHELGKIAGVSGQVIHNIETKKTKTSLEMLARLSWAFGMTVGELTKTLEPANVTSFAGAITVKSPTRR